MRGMIRYDDFDEAAIQNLVDHWKRGRTQGSIAEFLGCSQAFVSSLLRQNPEYRKLKAKRGGARQRGHTKKTIAKAQQVLSRRVFGDAWASIAADMGYTEMRIRQLYKIASEMQQKERTG